MPLDGRLNDRDIQHDVTGSSETAGFLLVICVRRKKLIGRKALVPQFQRPASLNHSLLSFPSDDKSFPFSGKFGFFKNSRQPQNLFFATGKMQLLQKFRERRKRCYGDWWTNLIKAINRVIWWWLAGTMKPSETMLREVSRFSSVICFRFGISVSSSKTKSAKLTLRDGIRTYQSRRRGAYWK